MKNKDKAKEEIESLVDVLNKRIKAKSKTNKNN